MTAPLNKVKISVYVLQSESWGNKDTQGISNGVCRYMFHKKRRVLRRGYVTGTNGAHEVGNDGESTNADTTERGSDGDVFVKSLFDVGVSETLDTHILVLELLSNISGGTATNLDPSLGEQGTGEKNESNVEDDVNGVVEDVAQCSGRGDVVSKTSDGDGVAAHLDFLPLTQESNDEVGSEFLVEDLGEEVKVGNKSRLENNGDVGSVEKLNGV